MQDNLRVCSYRSKIVGWLELCASHRGVRSISFTSSQAQIATATSPILDNLIAELDRYFRGDPVTFSVSLDPQSGTPFQRMAWDQLSLIPYGETRSYAQVAVAIGNPRGARAVGLANKHNPLPIVIPCHRVIRADGSLGGYASGTGMKRALLELEGIDVC